MIAKEVSYDLAIDEWKALLDDGSLTQPQQRVARFCLAGLQAEKDMAYHLRVFLGQRPEFQVFSNLEVRHGSLSAQIDHLVLTRWTVYFIESKSVSQVITVNEHGEWGRIHNRRFTPMESPVEQSHRHKEVLYDFLAAHRNQFMGKLLGIKLKNFARLLTPVHYVAVSSHGQIWGKGRSDFPEVMKADQIAGTILEYHESLKRGFFSTSLRDMDFDAFNDKEFKAVTAFILKNDVAMTPVEYAHEFIDKLNEAHQAEPLTANERDASDTEMAEPEPVKPQAGHGCRKCRSQRLCVLHGPYGYYFKCLECQANTPIAEICQKCSQKMKVSKTGREFTLVCESCQARSPFWTNPAEDAESPAPAPAASMASVANQPLCPKCGGDMKLRTAKKGANSGQQFWGCAKYPNCRGIVQA